MIRKTNRFVIDQYYIMMICLSGITEEVKKTSLYSSLNRNVFNMMINSIDKFHEHSKDQILSRFTKKEKEKLNKYAMQVADRTEQFIDLCYSMSDEEIDEMFALIDKKYEKWIETKQDQ